MVRIEKFAVEQWMDRYENTPGVINVAETCADSVSVQDLMQLSTDKSAQGSFDPTLRLTYGPIRGSSELRQRVAALCTEEGEPLSEEGVIITQGAINANFLSLYTLVGPGDHVVCVYPTYQQLYSVIPSLGGEVSLWRLKQEEGYVPKIHDLRSLIKSNTKMIIINNPNNPTGVPIPTAVLESIVQVAREHDLILFSDEVYRPLFHKGSNGCLDIPAGCLTLGYKKTVVTGSMSKAWALAGIRVGWIATRDTSIIEAIAGARDYTTISVSRIDDKIASYALSEPVRGPLLSRNIDLATHNAGLLREFIEKHHNVCSWVSPTAGTTAFVQFRKQGKPVNDVDFCRDLLDKTKVFFVPGSHCFGGDEDFPGYVRIGYVCETEVLEKGLARLETYINDNLV